MANYFSVSGLYEIFMPGSGLYHVWVSILRSAMLDLFYVVIALVFFLLCWAFTLACDRL